MKTQIIFEVEEEEKEKIKSVATRRGLPVASFCRYIIFREINQEEEIKNN